MLTLRTTALALLFALPALAAPADAAECAKPVALRFELGEQLLVDMPAPVGDHGRQESGLGMA